MKHIELFKKTVFVASGVALLMLFTLCNENETSTTESDTIAEPVVVEKTRAELIVNRDTMYIKDPKNITDFEYKHTPEITIGEIDDVGLTTVQVKVGSHGIVHPSEKGHWIDFLAIYVDGKEIERREAENGPGSNEASFEVNLKGAKEIKVVAGCNLHGIWMNTKKIK